MTWQCTAARQTLDWEQKWTASLSLYAIKLNNAQFHCNRDGFSVKTFHLAQFMWHKFFLSGNESFSNFNPHKLPTLYKSIQFLRDFLRLKQKGANIFHSLLELFYIAFGCTYLVESETTMILLYLTKAICFIFKMTRSFTTSSLKVEGVRFQ